MRFLVASFPEYGFLLPCLKVAENLRARGHELAVVTHPKGAPIVTRAGFERIPLGATDGDSFKRGYWSHHDIPRQYAHMCHAVATWRPDAVIASALALGPLAARLTHNLPTAVVGLVGYPWPKGEGQVEFPDHPSIQEEVTCLHRDMLGALMRTAQDLGIADDPRLHAPLAQSPLLGDLYLVRGVAAFEQSRFPLPERARFVGPLSDDRHEPPAGDLPQWLQARKAEGRTVLFVAHGRGSDIPDFWPNLLAAVSPTRHAVVVTSEHPDFDFAGLPAHVYGRKVLPRGPVLKAADAVIGLGRGSTVMGALAHGLPMLLFPLGGEQRPMTLRAVAAGVALEHSPYDWETGAPRLHRFQPDVLREALDRLTCPESPFKAAALHYQYLLEETSEPSSLMADLEALPFQHHNLLREV